MTKAQRVGVLAVLGVAACGPEPAQPAELRELCGEVGPVKVLELEESQRLYWEPRVMDGRWIFQIADLGEPEGAEPPRPVDVSVWSTDECGGDPRLIGKSVFLLSDYFAEKWPDALLACDRDSHRGIVRLDPHGEREQHVVFEGGGCGHGFMDRGFVTTRGEEGEVRELVSFPYPTGPTTGPVEPTVLSSDVRPPSAVRLNDYMPQVFEDRVYAIDTNNDLISIDLNDGSTRVEQAQVRLALVSPEQGYLAWQALPMTNDDEQWPRGEIWLRDNATGNEVLLGESSLTYDFHNMRLADEGIMWLRKEGTIFSDIRIYQLPSMEWVDVSGFGLGHVLDGHLIATHGYNGPYSLVDPTTGAKEVLFNGIADQVHSEDGLAFIEGLTCCIRPDHQAERPLWHVPTDGTAPTKLARRATLQPFFVEDGRWVTQIEVTKDWRSTLITIDPETLDELVIDTDVTRRGADSADALFPNTVAYSVDDPQRRGVWLAQLADE